MEISMFLCMHLYLATGMAVMSSVCEAEMCGTVHANSHLGNRQQGRSVLTETHLWALH